MGPDEVTLKNLVLITCFPMMESLFLFMAGLGCVCCIEVIEECVFLFNMIRGFSLASFQVLKGSKLCFHFH